MPPMTGGSTSGIVTATRSSRRGSTRQRSARASRIASGMPSTRHSAVAIVAVTTESTSACATAGLVTSCGHVAPRRADQQRDERQHQQGERDARPERGRPAMPCAHVQGGAPKPASVRTVRPSGPVSSAIHAEPSSGCGEPVISATGYALTRCARLGDLDALDLVACRPHVGDVHQTGVGLAQPHLRHDGLDVLLQRVGGGRDPRRGEQLRGGGTARAPPDRTARSRAPGARDPPGRRRRRGCPRARPVRACWWRRRPDPRRGPRPRRSASSPRSRRRTRRRAPRDTICCASAALPP